MPVARRARLRRHDISVDKYSIFVACKQRDVIARHPLDILHVLSSRRRLRVVSLGGWRCRPARPRDLILAHKGLLFVLRRDQGKIVFCAAPPPRLEEVHPDGSAAGRSLRRMQFWG